MLTRPQKIYIWMTAIFLTSLIIANLVGSMLFSFDLPGGVHVLLSAGIIPFPITFILTDLLNEFYGTSGARFVTLVGFAMSILTFGFLWVGQQLPVDGISQFTKPQFMHFSTMYTGMFLASLTAYLIGQLLDIQIFHAFKKITQNRMIWLRATGSTVISQLFDSIIVVFIAFWGAHPVEVLWQIAMGNYLWKFLIAVGITPVLYLGHALLKQLFLEEEALPTSQEDLIPIS